MKWCGVVIGLFFWPLAVLASAINGQDYTQKSSFSTWQGIEPDKWATIWLLKRHLSPNAYFLLVPPNQPLPTDSIAFGVPEAALKRGQRQSMFHHLKQAAQLSTPAIDALDDVIYDLEVNIWQKPAHPRVDWVETLYRQLQGRYRRDQVPVDCYLQFFDRVAQLLVNEHATLADYRQQLSLKKHCPGLLSKNTAFVEQIDHQQILRAIGLGQKVVFIDTREQAEFNEVRLPGAQWLPLRHVDSDAVTALGDADWIIPYCIKDFRGFEVAKAIKQHGGRRVATLSPHGLKGWLNADLPVVNATTSPSEAKATLQRCATEPQHCLGGDND